MMVNIFLKKHFLTTVELMILTSLFFLIGTINIVFLLLENHFYKNFVFSNFHIHPEILLSLTIFIWIVWTSATTIIYLNSFFRKKNLKKTKIKEFLFALLPLAIYLPIVNIRLAYPNFFEFLGHEDSLIEWLSAVSLILLSITSWLIFKKTNKKNTWKRIFLLLIAVGAFFVAGEEISWGQRIFDLTTPYHLQKVNVQNEITIHNIESVQNKMFYIYLLLSSIGSFGWIIKKFLMKKTGNSFFKELFFFIPDLDFATYSLPLFIYSVNRVFIGPIFYKTWEELAEMLFFIGFLLFIFNLHSNKKTIRSIYDEK